MFLFKKDKKQDLKIKLMKLDALRKQLLKVKNIEQQCIDLQKEIDNEIGDIVTDTPKTNITRQTFKNDLQYQVYLRHYINGEPIRVITNDLKYAYGYGCKVSKEVRDIIRSNHIDIDNYDLEQADKKES